MIYKMVTSALMAGYNSLFAFNAGKQSFNYVTFNFGMGVRLGS